MSKARHPTRLPILFLGLVLLGAASLLGYGPVTSCWTARQFLMLLSDPRVLRQQQAPLEQDLEIAGPSGPIRARLYRSARTQSGQAIVVAHGIHYRGIDEGRLVPFARALAQSGLVVLTPELADLADYRLTRDSVERITASVNYLVGRRDLVNSGRVGLLGFSFAGGQALVAASDPKLAAQLSHVVSVGGHHDLDRVFHFLLTDEIQTPRGVVKAKAHDYGLAVILYAHLGDVLAEPELTLTRDAFRHWLHEDRDKARSVAQSLTGRGAQLFQRLQEQRLPEIAPDLKSLVAAHRRELVALSPAGRLQKIAAPVYLLHGSHDSVIPPSETDFAALELRDHPHDALVTPLIEHVEVARDASVWEKLRLVTFMSHLF